MITEKDYTNLIRKVIKEKFIRIFTQKSKDRPLIVDDTEYKKLLVDSYFDVNFEVEAENLLDKFASSDTDFVHEACVEAIEYLNAQHASRQNAKGKIINFPRHGIR